LQQNIAKRPICNSAVLTLDKCAQERISGEVVSPINSTSSFPLFAGEISNLGGQIDSCGILRVPAIVFPHFRATPVLQGSAFPHLRLLCRTVELFPPRSAAIRSIPAKRLRLVGAMFPYQFYRIDYIAKFLHSYCVGFGSACRSLRPIICFTPSAESL